MNNFKRYCTILVLLMLIFAFPAWVQGVTLDTSGTCEPGYVCNSGAFQFLGTKWYDPHFSIDLNHQCSGVNLNQYMPGWGGGGVDFKVVKIHGEYNYDTGFTKEKLIHEGKVIIEETLYCAKNPWAYGSEAGCGAPTIKNNVIVCTVPVPLQGPFPLSVRYLPNDLLMALRQWDEKKNEPDPLADWDPYGTPDGYSALKIISPASNAIIGEHVSSFTLALQNLPPANAAKKVLMQWYYLKEIPAGWQGDIYMSESTYDWYPFNGPPSAMSTAFPLTVAVEPGYFAGKPGRYRVQVKLESETWWSPWRNFWIGQPTFTAGKFKKIETMAAKTEKKMITAKMLGPMKSQGTGGPAASSTKVAKQVVTLKKAVVVVESLAYKPAPTTPGKMVDLIITFKNKGLADSSASLKYSVSCIVKSGGPACAVASSTRSINKAIPAGQTHSITLAGATPAVAGTYEVTVKPEGGAVDSGKTITINVGLKIKPTKGTLTPTKRQ